MIKLNRYLIGTALLCLPLATQAQIVNLPGDVATSGTDLNDARLGNRSASILTASDLGSVAATPASISDLIAARAGQPGTGPALTIVSEYGGRNGRTHLRLAQYIGGLRVHGAYVKATADAGGQLTHLVSRTQPTTTNTLLSPAFVSEDAAIAAAVSTHFGGPQDPDVFHQPPRAEKVIIARQSGIMSEAFLVTTWSEADNKLYETLVDGRGNVLESELRTSQDSYRVFADHPGKGGQVTRQGPGSGNAASPAGWLSGSQTTRQIRGNNVSAYLDRNANNTSDGGGTSVTNGVFDAPHFPFEPPTFRDNQDAAVQNLFYWNNRIHDELHGHGFTEGAGNFQENNFGRGGAGSDSVNAEAQDGGGTNNANFATPSDGQNPRMQMYVWDATNPNRDGDLDSDIIWHEYGHGLTWRMIGNMSGPISGAIGEGMGDVLAILKNNDDRVGEYSANRPAGIRSARYTDYPRSIGDFQGRSVHFDGEIYAATLWRAGQLYRAAGLTNDDLLDTAIDGMNFTPAQPDYLEMRDGILAAAPNTREACMIWEAFADYGMGQGAVFAVDSRGRLSITESDRTPSACSGGGNTPPAFDASVSRLTGGATRTSWYGWSARVNVYLEGANRAGTQVGARWSTGNTSTCTTNSAGTCTVQLTGLSRYRNASVTITIETVGGRAATGSPLSGRLNRP